MSVDGYRCSECRRPGVRVRPVRGVGRTDPSLPIGEALGACGRGSCPGTLLTIPVEDADRELRDALIEAGVITGVVSDVDHSLLEDPREPEPI